ncbi:MAG TPA: glycosyltransferase family 4 protein [Caulobacteraceae bacterium]|nr:glycosyltransferase family 4 protein [Caulobacteraceae bacterium]
MTSPSIAPPRVLILARSLPFHAQGGMEAGAWDLARALTARGCEVRVLTTSCPGRSSGLIEGIEVQFADAPPQKYSAAWSRESIRAFNETYADWAEVVMSVSAAAFPLAAHLVHRRSRPAIVMQAHGTAWRDLVSRFKTNNPLRWLKAVREVRGMTWDFFSYRRFDEVISIGQAVTQDMRRLPTRFLLRGVSVVQIDNGIDETFFAFSPEARQRKRQALGVPQSAPMLVTAARLNVQKGTALALESFALLTHTRPDLHYLIVGDGPERERLRARAEALGVADKVRFAGAVGRDEVSAYLSAGDIFVFPTLRQEGLPLNVLEAFASGLPAVISEHICEPHFPAVGVDPQDVKGMAATLEQLLASPSSDRASTLPERHALAFAAAAYQNAFADLLAARSSQSHAVPAASVPAEGASA